MSLITQHFHSIFFASALHLAEQLSIICLGIANAIHSFGIYIPDSFPKVLDDIYIGWSVYLRNLRNVVTVAFLVKASTLRTLPHPSTDYPVPRNHLLGKVNLTVIISPELAQVRLHWVGQLCTQICLIRKVAFILRIKSKNQPWAQLFNPWRN